MNALTKEEFDQKADLAQYKLELFEVQKRLMEEEQIECEAAHAFSPGLYLRQIYMPKGAIVIGKTHKTEHFNIVLSGSASVMIDGVICDVKAPYIFKSKPNDKKVLHIHEDMIWATTHVTEETDISKLNSMMVCDLEEEKELIDQFIEKLKIDSEQKTEVKQ